MRSPAGNFLPDFCRNPVVFIFILLAQLLAILLALAEPRDLDALWVRLGELTLFVQWCMLCSIALLCLARRRLGRLGRTWIITLAAFGLTQAVALTLSLAAFEFMRWYTPDWEDVNPDRLMFVGRNLTISGIVTLLALRYFYVQHLWRQQLRAEAEARLQALQARIRPHFLFNSLNTIADLIRRRPDEAEDAVLDLADLLRATLRERETFTLDEELDLIRGYLRLQALRLGERLRVDWQLADDLPLSMPIPALILQPLVENAVLHGIQPRVEGGVVRIAVRLEAAPLGERRLRFEVGNPYLPPAEAQPATRGTGTALDNVRQRLALAYGERGRLTVARDGGEFRVVLTLPISGV